MASSNQGDEVNEPGQKRRLGRVPRIAVVLVAIAALGLTMALVFLAWRSSESSKPTEPTAAVDGDSATGPSTDSTSPGGGDIFTQCTTCHKDLDLNYPARESSGLLYRHEKHFAKGVSDCSQCHVNPTHEPDKINKPTMTRCFVCHGLTEQSIAPGVCTTCHPADFPALPTSHQDPAWKTAHGKTAQNDPFLCTSCHEQAKCTTCHGLDMPHPKGWKDELHAQTFFKVGMATCTNCHARSPEAVDKCDSCHHPKQPKGVPWRQAHPTIVKAQGGDTCFECHDPATCAACHVRGQEDFGADEALLEGGSSGAAGG